MKHIGLYDRKFDVSPVMQEIEAHPELWNQYKGRLNHPQSPHRDTDDIWIRFAKENLEKPEERVMGPHESVWYPASETLSRTKRLAQEMFDFVDGETMGGVLIIRVPSGKAIYPHVDLGWHAAHYRKIAVQLSADVGQSFTFEDGGLNARAGESYWLDNSHPHWVTNPTPKDWINMTVCYRT
jgi:hypothetical protein